MNWPILVTAETYARDGKKVRLRRTVEGAGNAVGSMLRAVMLHPRAHEFLGVEIQGLTPLGQCIFRVLDCSDGEYFLKPHS